MRTKHLLMAIATLLVAGCSQNEITEVRTVGNPAVGFDVYTGVATKRHRCFYHNYARNM